VVVCSGGEEVVVPSLLLTSVLPWLATLMEEEGSHFSLLSIPSISSSTLTTLLTSFYSNTPTKEGLEAMHAIQALSTETPEIVNKEKVEEMLVVKEVCPGDNLDTKHEVCEEGEITKKKSKTKSLKPISEKKSKKNEAQQLNRLESKQFKMITSFLCPDCGEDFTKCDQPVEEYKKHMKHAHRDTESKGPGYRTGVRKYDYICPDCGKDYRNAGNAGSAYNGRAQKYEKHLWKCKVERFSCDCPGVPVIEPANQTVYSKDECRGNIYDYQRKWQHMQVAHCSKHACLESRECPETFDTNEDLHKHIDVKHADKEYGRLHNFDCGDCGKQFNKLTVPNHHDLKKEIEKHKRMHSVLSFLCDCPEQTLVKAGQEFGIHGLNFSAIFREKEKHMLVVHEGWFGCKAKLCLRSFKSAGELSGHMKYHRKYVCDLCGFEATHEKLRYHRREVHEKTSFPCEDCGKQFVTQTMFNVHKRKVHVEKVACQDCGAMVKSLTRHRDAVHTADEDKKFQCEECNKGFQDKLLLKIHMESVHSEAPQHQCRYGCENRYRNLSNLSAHERKMHGQIWKKRDLKVFERFEST